MNAPNLLNRQHQYGFTLLELIVVLVIISVLLAVTAPRLAGRNQAALLRGAGHDLQTLATAARARAVLTGQVVDLMLSRDGNELRLISEQPPVALEATEDLEDTPTLIDLMPVRRLPPGIHARFEPEDQGKTDVIRFRPDGSADGGELQISNTQGQELLFKLSQPLGQLRLTDGS